MIGLILTLLACHPDDRPAPVDCAAVDTTRLPEAPELQRWLDARVERGVPGIQLTVDRPGVGAWHGAAGFADLDERRPMEACDLTRAGSINKTVTALAALQLVDEGRWSLDAPLGALLDEAVIGGIANADRATLRQVLGHQSGIPNWIWSLDFQTASLDDLEREWTAAQLLRIARRMPAPFSPGARAEYSNTNTLLVGLALEAEEGRPLAEILRARVFDPLGLETTRFAAPDPIPDALVSGYVDLRNDGRLTDSTQFSGWDVHADGGLLSRPSELVQLMRGANDGTLLSQATTDAMHEVRAPEADEGFFDLGFGLGVFRIDTPQGVWWFHSGDAIGYWATALVRASDGLAVSWAVNGNYGTLDEATSSREAYEEVLAIVGP